MPDDPQRDQPPVPEVQTSGPADGASDDESTGWSFPRSFWTANAAELFERAAFYGMFISLTLYLTRVVGFSDVGAGLVDMVFAAFIYFAPPFAGAVADKIGFRRALMMAFGLLAVGYATLGLFPENVAFLSGTVPFLFEGGTFIGGKVTSVLALLVVAVGGAFVKSVITGTVAKTSTAANRARAYSIFYAMVNIGAFSGKTLAKPLRTGLGLSSINFASAGFALIALVLVAMLFKRLDRAGEGKSVQEVWRGFVRVVTNVRFMALIVIVGGFWSIQHQMYATMPKYVLRMVGEGAAPEWYANVNPFVVVMLVVPITHLVRKLEPITSIGIALAIIPVSALVMSLSPTLAAVAGPEIALVGGLTAHPITVALVLGIALQAVSECFLSPRFLEYASKQAPEGETGLYMGYSHLTSFFANLLAFGISGYLLQAWCPNPAELAETHPNLKAALAAAEAGGPAVTPAELVPEAYAHSHYIWYVFVGIGVTAFCALIVFRLVTARLDRKSGQRPSAA